MKGIYKTVNDILKETSVDICNIMLTAEFTTKLQKYFCKYDDKRKKLKINVKYIKLHKDDIDLLKEKIKEICINININTEIVEETYNNAKSRYKYICECGEILFMFRRPRINQQCIKCNKLIDKNEIKENFT